MESHDAGKGLSAFSVLRALKRRKFYVLIPTLLFTAGAAYLVTKLPEHYRARTLVGTQTPPFADYLSDKPAVPVTATVQEQLRAVRESLFNPSVLGTVAAEFPRATLKSGESRSIDALKSKIQIEVEGPDAFYIGFEGDDPQQVARVANRLAQLFIERTSDVHGQKVEQADTFLDEEVERARNQLVGEDDGLKAYRQSVAQELPERLQTNLKLIETLQQQIQEKTDHIAEEQARRSASIDELKTLEDQGALQPEPFEKTPADTSLEEARLKLRQLKSHYTSEYPAIAPAEKEVRDAEAAAASSPRVRRAPTPLQMRYFALEAELKSIDQRLKSYAQERDRLTMKLAGNEHRIDATPGYETTLNQRAREEALARSRYEALVAKQQDTKLNQRAEKKNEAAVYKILEPAQPPLAPFSPHRNRIILLTLLASLAAGLGAVFLAEQMDSSFDTVEELQRFCSLPVLSSVPKITNRMSKPNDRKSKHLALQGYGQEEITPEQRQLFQKKRLVILSDPHALASEQYRILTYKVQHWMAKSGGRILVLTSAAGAEGKSVTALNLSFALASSFDERILLIDGDLRRPRVHEYLGIAIQKGLCDLVAEPDTGLHDYITRVGNVDVMTGGSQVMNPVGLLASNRARDIFGRLQKDYRLIVVDSPPLVPTADSHILAGLADGVLVVARARQTKRELFQRALESLGSANLLGVVLNDVDYGDTRYAYAYHYYQRQYLDRS
jgi:polysaccharide chain length determinant protein (PEP-CTERM system associated)